MSEIIVTNGSPTPNVNPLVFTESCGCKITLGIRVGGRWDALMTRCPMHAAAPDLLEALENLYHDQQGPLTDAMKEAQEAIAAATSANVLDDEPRPSGEAITPDMPVAVEILAMDAIAAGVEPEVAGKTEPPCDHEWGNTRPTKCRKCGVGL